ncbi:MAG: CBS domain-containing protein [Candidatus Aenigmatarchaeota archaeon]|nr:CBS domain-containing protein [Candidatus Aenigmarchaeota archaeon]
MLVMEAMNRDVKTIRPDATVKEAARIMNQNRIGSLVVVSGSGEVVGIVTERDILVDIVAEGKDSSNVQVEEIMSKKIIVVDPHQSLEEAADIMVKNHIKKLPVVEAGRLVGIITASDLIKYERALIERIAHLIAASPIRQIGG